MLWNTSYETGVPLMDAQHQELFQHLDILADRTRADSVPQTLEFLGKYVDKHFRDEEHLHAASRYPQRLEHKKMHADFVASYKSLMDEYHDKPGQKGLMTLRINRVAVDWLKKHILGPDMAFATYSHERRGAATANTDEAMRQLRDGSIRSFERGEPPVARASVRSSDEEVLRRVPAQALADELVRRTRVGDAARAFVPKTTLAPK